tara:strand:- start:2154 stop:2408 length:255 start_codon:yes stop_codon:yes gene_type:complete
MCKTTKESYTWNPKSQEWELSLKHDDKTLKEIEDIEKQIQDSGEDACVQFEKSWNEIFLLKATCETTDFDPSTILQTGIIFAKA